MRTLFRELAGYTVASAVALAADMSLLWLLVTLAGWGYLVAATTSFMVGAAVAYAISVKLAFKHHRMGSRRTEFATFVALGTIGLGVNTAVMSIAVGYLGLHILLAKSAAACCTFACNFMVRRQILFVPRSVAGGPVQ